MKILVTGSEGFIGKHVMRIAQERGHRVTGVDRKNDQAISTYHVDQFDCVIHLAGDIDIKESFDNPWKYVDNNINTLRYLQEAKHVVFASSAAVYGERSPYGLTKALGEFLLPENSVSLRLFNPFGPGEEHDPETHLIPTLMKGGTTLYHHGQQMRDFIFVYDAAEAFVLAAEKEITGTFDLCDTPMHLLDVADLMGVDYTVVPEGRDAGDSIRLLGNKNPLRMVLGWEPQYDVKEQLKNWRNWNDETNITPSGYATRSEYARLHI